MNTEFKVLIAFMIFILLGVTIVGIFETKETHDKPQEIITISPDQFLRRIVNNGEFTIDGKTYTVNLAK